MGRVRREERASALLNSQRLLMCGVNNEERMGYNLGSIRGCVIKFNAVSLRRVFCLTTTKSFDDYGYLCFTGAVNNRGLLAMWQIHNGLEHI